MKPKIKVLVVYGGKSAEHEVSCRSAAFVLRNLNPNKYEIETVAVNKSGRWLKQDTPALLAAIQSSKSVPILGSMQALPASSILANSETLLDAQRVVFPVIHGTGGEDGSIQGLLDLSDTAYIGPDILGSAIGMDKVVAKKLAATAGVNIVPFIDIKIQFWKANQDDGISLAERELGYPMFVKPARLGSSVGVNKAKNRDDLRKHINTAFEFDDKVLIEKGLDVREIECAVLGDYNPEVSIPGEVLPTNDFYSYEAKYIDAEGAKMKIPADLTADQAKIAQAIAKKVFQALELYGMARVDLFLEKKTNQFYLNEVNTIPGFTEISQYPMLWAASGISNQSLIDKLIELALKRHEVRKSLKRSI
jgi:D-alanine-D-alanine ligase